jgi:hypothetical protein
MPYKYELHAHTKEVSQCGKVPASEAVRMYREKGYNGIVFTDHYSPLTFTGIRRLMPQKYWKFYISGYENGLKAASKYPDFTVLLGMELRYYGTGNDYLVYGVWPEFIKNAGNLMALHPKSFYRLAHRNGLIVLQAHPFRPYIYRTNPKYLDGCEVFNGKNSPEENIKSLQWFEKSGMKIKVSGSDFHRPPHLAKGGIITDVPIKTNADLINVLKSGDYDLIENS